MTDNRRCRGGCACANPYLPSPICDLPRPRIRGLWSVVCCLLSLVGCPISDLQSPIFRLRSPGPVEGRLSSSFATASIFVTLRRDKTARQVANVKAGIVIRMKQIETKRLILRPVDVERDAAFVLQMLNEPDYIANVADRGVRTVAAAKDYIREKFLLGHERYGVGYCVAELKSSGTPAGSCGLIKRDGMEDFDIGYSTLTQYAGNGYAFEAASAMMEYCRTQMDLKRIVAFTSPTNLKSAHLLEKLGLRFERMVQVPGFEIEARLYAWEQTSEIS